MDSISHNFYVKKTLRCYDKFYILTQGPPAHHGFCTPQGCLLRDRRGRKGAWR